MTTDRELADAYGLIVDLKARTEALERFVRATDAVEAGVSSFDLQHAVVRELVEARRAIDWMPLPSLRGEEAE